MRRVPCLPSVVALGLVFVPLAHGCGAPPVATAPRDEVSVPPVVRESVPVSMADDVDGSCLAELKVRATRLAFGGGFWIPEALVALFPEVADPTMIASVAQFAPGEADPYEMYETGTIRRMWGTGGVVDAIPDERALRDRIAALRDGGLNSHTLRGADPGLRARWDGPHGERRTVQLRWGKTRRGSDAGWVSAVLLCEVDVASPLTLDSADALDLVPPKVDPRVRRLFEGAALLGVDLSADTNHASWTVRLPPEFDEQSLRSQLDPKRKKSDLSCPLRVNGAVVDAECFRVGDDDVRLSRWPGESALRVDVTH